MQMFPARDTIVVDYANYLLRFNNPLLALDVINSALAVRMVLWITIVRLSASPVPFSRHRSWQMRPTFTSPKQKSRWKWWTISTSWCILMALLVSCVLLHLV